MSRTIVLAIVILGCAFAACEEPRDSRSLVTYTDQVQPLLDAQCSRCHAKPAPAGGWAADSYVGAIGCTASGENVVHAGAGAPPPLLEALNRSDHAGFASAAHRELLSTWVASGAPRSGGGVHRSSFADPRSPQSHGVFLRTKRYAPMLDADDPDACGTCHEGVSSRRDAARVGAANAPSCTSCHGESNGPLACGTCHGDGARVYPPRNRCFFPTDRADHAHGAHAGPSASRANGLPCSTCHPAPATGQFDGVHANGYVDVWFDFAVAGREARFDATSESCSGTCHARGGARPSPTWSDSSMNCNDCHTSPPSGHYRGACTSCHHEANADGTALNSPVLHVNGKVDLGDGSGRCGACHGRGDDPWPSTGAHQAHANPKNGRPVECVTCHELPTGRHPEGKGAATVRLGGLAVRGGRRASFDAASATCSGTYCHEGAGATNAAPRWTDTAPLTCASCHLSPPPPPHSQSTTCGGASCHEGRTSGLAMTAAGRLTHVDGVIDRGPL